MADDKDNKLEDEPSAPANEGLDETTADNAAERLYDEDEAWKKSKNSLFLAMGVVAAVVGVYVYFDKASKEAATERSGAFLAATVDANGTEKRFLDFAAEYDDALGGVALYRAACEQYLDSRFDEAAATFGQAAAKLGDVPPLGRALLGQGTSLLKAGKTAEGQAALAKLAEDGRVLPTDRHEARYLLAIQALSAGNAATLETQKAALAADLNASAFHERLVRYEKAKAILAGIESIAERNAESGKAFLEENKARDGVVTLESGLQYEILTDANGTKPDASDEVEVHYHGTLLNGEVFDSSVERGEPSKFSVAGVIKGWTEALKLMPVGAKWKLFIPADIAYGENGSGSIGPNETLIFEVELLGITPRAQPEPVVPEVNATAPAPAPEGNATTPVLETPEGNFTPSAPESNATEPEANATQD